MLKQPCEHLGWDGWPLSEVGIPKERGLGGLYANAASSPT